MLGKQQLPGLFSGLVVIARAKHPIPSRTRPLSAVAPMVLRLKTWESRSPPNLKRDTSLINDANTPDRKSKPSGTDAGWSSPVARQAHNLKAAGSNPAPATTFTEPPKAPQLRGLWRSEQARSAPSAPRPRQRPPGRLGDAPACRLPLMRDRLGQRDVTGPAELISGLSFG